MLKTSIIRLNAVYFLSLQQAVVFLCILSTQPLVHSKTNCNSDRVDYTKTGIPFLSTSLNKILWKKERKKLASSILLLRKRSNHHHSIFAVFHAECNNIFYYKASSASGQDEPNRQITHTSQVQRWALSAN